MQAPAGQHHSGHHRNQNSREHGAGAKQTEIPAAVRGAHERAEQARGVNRAGAEAPGIQAEHRHVQHD